MANGLLLITFQLARPARQAVMLLSASVTKSSKVVVVYGRPASSFQCGKFGELTRLSTYHPVRDLGAILLSSTTRSRCRQICTCATAVAHWCVEACVGVS